MLMVGCQEQMILMVGDPRGMKWDSVIFRYATQNITKFYFFFFFSFFNIFIGVSLLYSGVLVAAV